jgi:hypothetical protein
MANKHSERVEFDTELALGDGTNLDVCIGFMRTTVFGRDLYGADADGNRGMWVDTIDEDEYSCITVSWHISDTEMVSFPAVNLPGTVTIEGVNAAIEAYMESHEATGPEEREEDCDDRDEDE